MTSIDSTNDQNIRVELFKSTFTHKRSSYASKEKLETGLSSCYTRNIFEIRRVENWMYRLVNVESY